MLAKSDIQSAFRLLPIHPNCFKLLGFHFEGQYYFDKCLPMGYFELFASFLEWTVTVEAGSKLLLHYLDDFLFVGPANSKVCAAILEHFTWLCNKFGIPLAEEKTVSPCNVIQFLGIEIDSQKMEFRLPEEKLKKLRKLVLFGLQCKKIKLRQLQSLIGHLNFATKVIPVGRVFNRRLSALTAGVDNPEWHLRIPKSIKEDLAIWNDFLSTYNGKSVWQSDFKDNEAINLFTDAAASCGYGAFLRGQWSAQRWPEQWKGTELLKNLVFLEFFPIVVAIELWGEQLANKRIILNCDNQGVVHVINNLSTSSPPVWKLLRYSVLRTLKLNIWFKAKHLSGYTNKTADAISRLQIEVFRCLQEQADPLNTPCPQHIWNIVWMM
ncbi:uncharacterized protein LOC121396391 [Xenopus laevis]|uniref:ribonuclease H n=1 Tax=Xenopus laevis TaxID=8355 RepID=A0A8J1LCI4_XENLA|nr:uncharacterized protein LOC121396391 [Xenopus laevis]XP_041427191.1 uncharacterized protein LOC121396391 [Xenopus laevis]